MRCGVTRQAGRAALAITGRLQHRLVFEARRRRAPIGEEVVRGAAPGQRDDDRIVGFVVVAAQIERVVDIEQRPQRLPRPVTARARGDVRRRGFCDVGLVRRISVFATGAVTRLACNREVRGSRGPRAFVVRDAQVRGVAVEALVVRHAARVRPPEGMFGGERSLLGLGEIDPLLFTHMKINGQHLPAPVGKHGDRILHALAADHPVDGKLRLAAGIAICGGFGTTGGGAGATTTAGECTSSYATPPTTISARLTIGAKRFIARTRSRSSHRASARALRTRADHCHLEFALDRIARRARSRCGHAPRATTHSRPTHPPPT